MMRLVRGALSGFRPGFAWPRLVELALILRETLKGKYAFFDRQWYLRTYPDVRSAGVPPLLHYFTHGRNEGRSPNGLVDANWYSERHKGIMADLDFWDHFIPCGIPQHLSPHPFFDASYYSRVRKVPNSTWVDFFREHDLRFKTPSVFSHYSPLAKSIVVNTEAFRLSDVPLVSIVIVNKNGQEHLHDLFSSISAQAYQNFEVVFVDNGSNDSSVSIAKQSGLPIKVMRVRRNVGFAEGNNLGALQSRGELIALVNTDVRLDSDWLSSMVTTMRSDPLVAATTSKLRFWCQFIEICIESNEYFDLDVAATLDCLQYKKVFVKEGRRTKAEFAPTSTGNLYRLKMFFPVQSVPYQFQIRRKDAEKAVIVTTRFRRFVYDNDQAKIDAIIHVLNPTTSAFWILNNTGSVEGYLGDLQDRGIGQPDIGQFDLEEPIPFMCAAAAVVRRDALYRDKLFISEMFCYFEDSDLSVRLRKRGFTIKYCPSAIAYHKHSATSVEYSYFWLSHVWRNRAFYRWMHGPAHLRPDVLRRELRRLTLGARRLYGPSAETDSRVAELRSQLLQLVDQHDGAPLRRRRLRIAIYNSFWNTYGGGEAHALRMALLLSRYGTIELLAEEDFDIDELGATFDLPTANLSKRIVRGMTPELTGEYDVFVNSTFCNHCPSRAAVSLYIVSFPDGPVSKEFIKSYRFLPNSEYTSRWVKKIWGNDVSIEPFTPALDERILGQSVRTKKKILLNVGRFFLSGHCKNQHLIAAAYRQILEVRPDLECWQLVLAGSAADDDYVKEIAFELRGTPGRIIVNASRAELLELYEDAYLYLHATGLGYDEDTNPEKMEHFGISVIEAAVSGCFPIVYEAGGPADIVRELGVGTTYSSMDDMKAVILSEIDRFERREEVELRADALRKGALVFSRQNADSKVRRFLDRIVSDRVSHGRVTSNPVES